MCIAIHTPACPSQLRAETGGIVLGHFGHTLELHVSMPLVIVAYTNNYAKISKVGL